MRVHTHQHRDVMQLQSESRKLARTILQGGTRGFFFIIAWVVVLLVPQHTLNSFYLAMTRLSIPTRTFFPRLKYKVTNCRESRAVIPSLINNWLLNFNR